MKIALASPAVASTIDDGLAKVEECVAEAASKGANIVCFPEAYLPGLRGQDFTVPDFDEAVQAYVVAMASRSVAKHGIATVLGMEWITAKGRHIVAVVFNADGSIQGYQTKNQLDPTEDKHYIPGSTRQLFEVDQLKFGVAICHEGWRYPETVRWAAMRGAKVVFHPQLTGTVTKGIRLTEWGSAAAPYYEKAMMMRSIENTIYFASVNYGVPFQEAATTLIDPGGHMLAHLPYGEPGVLIADIDPIQATGLLAGRFAPDRYAENVNSFG